MEKLLVLYLVLPLWLIFLFQPFLNEVEETRNMVSKIAIEHAAEQAAVVGYFTPEIKEEIINKMQRVGYKEEEIQLELTETIQERTSYVTGKITVPNKYYNILLINLLRQDNEEDLYHVNYATRMSEYIP